MDTDIRERLEEEMTKCNSLKLYKDRVRKLNNIFPDEVVENILSFTSCGCKKCVKTRKVIDEEVEYIQLIRNKWDGINLKGKMFSKEFKEYLQDGLRIWSYYFVKLNGFTTDKYIQQHVKFNKIGSYRVVKHFYRNIFYIKNEFKLLGDKIKDPLHDTIRFILYERKCKYYSNIFNRKFKDQLMRYMFHEIL